MTLSSWLPVPTVQGVVDSLAAGALIALVTWLSVRLFQRWRGIKSKWEKRRIEKRLAREDRFVRDVIMASRHSETREYFMLRAAELRFRATVAVILFGVCTVSSQFASLRGNTALSIILGVGAAITLTLLIPMLVQGERYIEIVYAAVTAGISEATDEVSFNGKTYAVHNLE